ncbi:MAG TPA: YdeI/OmpD-associated family protein [Pyrinomonadaceae bacterium]|nr:YdeI/OmpD-associated family protein [Pyrinomonadaceae bacterium]
MGKRDERIDAYIEKSADFAKPILRHLRELVHRGCPEVEETMKWSFPHFDYKGGILCSAASFKRHCAFGFRKASLLPDADKLLARSREAMGQFGQIKSLEDLPPDDVLIGYIKEAARLNEENVKLPSGAQASSEKKEIVVPADVAAALRQNRKASETFENFSRSHKKEYVQWITEAKTVATRDKRLATAIEWLSEGKSKNWKYERK